MGFFSGKKRTYVGSTTAVLIEDIPETLKNSVFGSVYSRREIGLGMVDDLVNGANANMRRVKRYGKKSYIHGLPSSIINSMMADGNALQNVITAEIGKPVTLHSYAIVELTPELDVLYFLHNTLEYDPINDEVNNPEYFLDDIKNEIKANPSIYVNASTIRDSVSVPNGYNLDSINVVSAGPVNDEDFIEEGITYTSLEDATQYRTRYIWEDNTSTYDYEVHEISVGPIVILINYWIFLKFNIPTSYWVNLSRNTHTINDSRDANGIGTVTDSWENKSGNTTESDSQIRSTVYDSRRTREDTTTAVTETTVDPVTGASTTTVVGTENSWTDTTNTFNGSFTLTKGSNGEFTSAYIEITETVESSNSSGASSNSTNHTITNKYLSTDDLGNIITVTEVTTNGVLSSSTSAGNTLGEHLINGRGVTYKESKTITNTIDEARNKRFEYQNTHMGKEQYYVNYSYVDDAGVTQYRVWTHPYENATIPELKPNQTNFVDDEFYPVVPVRMENRNIGAESNVDTEEYKTTEKLLSYMGMDLETVTKQLNENPDINDIDRAYIWYAVPVGTEYKEGQEYLYHFFNELNERSIHTKADYLAWAAKIDEINKDVDNSLGDWDIFLSKPENALVIKDSLLDLTFSFSFVDKTIHTGQLEPGVKIKSTKIKIEKRKYVTTWNNNGTKVAGLTGLFLTDTGQYSLIIQHQVSEDTYEELEIHSLGCRNLIKNGKAVYTGLSDVLYDPDNPALYVPLVEAIARKLNIVKRDQLYYQSLLMIINAYEIVKTKWYQTGFFKAAILIVSFYLSAPEIGIALAGITTVVQFLTFIATVVVVNLLVQKLMELAVKVFGEEIAMVMALVAMVVGIGQRMKWFNTGFLSAGQFMSLGNGLISAVNKSITEELTDLANASSAMAKEYGEKFDELEKIQKEMNGDWGLDPLTFTSLNPLIIPGESPEYFYYRMTEMKNPGVKAVEAISTYIDTMLQLPEFKDTMVV